MRYIVNVLLEDIKTEITLRADADRKTLAKRAAYAIAPKLQEKCELKGALCLNYVFHGILYDCASEVWITDTNGKKYFLIITHEDGRVVLGDIPNTYYLSGEEE